MPTRTPRLLLTALAVALFVVPCMAQDKTSKAEVAPIAEEAFIYAFPMVMNYGTMYAYAIDQHSGQYKAPFNQIFNEADVFTPKDTAIVTPNSDTPYSFLWMDLRAEPIVLCVPEVEKGRYYAVQLVDLYTFNYGYLGSRTTGNGAGCYLVAGPGYKGATPPGIKKGFRSETEFSLAGYRTQLFNPGDIDNVRKIQAGYRAQPLSQFLHQPAPKPAPQIDWPPFDKKQAADDPFSYLSFLLQLCPPVGAAAVEKPLRARFATLGIEAGKPFSIDALTAEQKAALAAGARRGIERIKAERADLGHEVNGWRIMTGGIGDRTVYKGDWLRRAAVAMAGIYGNDAAEAVYPLLVADSDGNKPDTGKSRYTLTFPADELPPVNAFWSITMYDGKTQLLVANPIHRYLINSPMLPGLKKSPDGSLTVYLQKDAPGKERQPNWLPAPDGPIYVVMRLYWPKDAALNGTWNPPPVQRVQTRASAR